MNIKWNKYTWYSKLAAIIFFIAVFPTWTFYLGTLYQKTVSTLDSLAADASPVWNRQRDADLGISFKYPQEFVVKKYGNLNRDEIVFYTVTNPDGDKANLEFTFERTPGSDETTTEYVNRLNGLWKEYNADATNEDDTITVGEKITTAIDGIPAIEQLTTNDKTGAENLVTYIKKDGVLYTLSLSGPKGHATKLTDSQKAIYHQILSTFKFAR